MRLSIAIPTSGMVRAEFAFSLATLLAKLAAGIPTLPGESIEVQLDYVLSSVIHSNREALVNRAIERQCTHLLFLDDDMQFEPLAVEILLGRRLPVVCSNYLIKRDEAKEFVAVGLNGQRVETAKHSTGLQEVLYSGFGVSLFALEAFTKASNPWFQTDYNPDTKGYSTEDLPCYRRLREAGYPAYLDHDASKLVGHVGSKTWRWGQ